MSTGRATARNLSEGATSPNLRAVPQRETPRYREDIDGLRAVAVLAVIAFHANAQLVPGGFAGVDVFFVISGYLLTGLILNALENGTFRFADFYSRRIKRIFPAYIAVSLVTLAVSSWLLIPNDYIFYTTSLAASWAFVSNIFFSMLSWGYFGQRTEEFPLLHTWSLSVEEQFYFLFPLLLIGLFRYCRKYIVACLTILGIALAIVSEMKTGEIKSYFLLTSRAHELIIGALTFLVLRRYPPRPGLYPAVLAVAGMAMVIGSFLLINKDMPFPGINSLFPCMGTALLIAGCRCDNVVSATLRTKPLVAVGLLSYSLYLWHWPIFAFLKYRQVEMTLSVGTAAVATAFALAWVTWRFIETPPRRNAALGFRPAFLRLYALPAALFMSVGLFSYVTEGAPQRFSGDLRALISSYSFERDLTRSCSVRAEDYKMVTLDYLQANCAFGATTPEKARVMLMGDSHAHHFKPFVEQLVKDAGLKAVYHVQGGCFPTELQVTDRQPERGPDTCQQRNADLLKLASHFDYVVLAGFWASEPERELEKELRYVVDAIVAAGATPVIFKDNPFHEPDLSRCILYRKRGWMEDGADCHIPYQTATDAQAQYDAIVERMKVAHPRTIVIDPRRVMCNDKECLTYTGNTALYKDANHLNTRASQLLGDWYISRVGNPLVNGRPDR
ncbi:MAG TPA: acyltransferase family protein [Noviherbaspirillum sp.]|nr:acyltransferase family protein [Noviherbaspirillum sp.]